MTKIYTEPNAYDVISRDIENNFHRHINKNKEEIKSIVIVGGYHCDEAEKFLKNYPNSTLFIFEPVFDYFSVLKQIYGNNQRCKLFNLAISDEIGELNIYRTSSPGSDSIFQVIENNESGYKFKTTHSEVVKCNKLSNVINDNIDLLSIDVQGAELKVLKGTDLNKVSCIFAEIQMSENKHNIVYDGQCFSEDLHNYLDDKFFLHSLGLDNILKNGTGNSFWIKNEQN